MSWASVKTAVPSPPLSAATSASSLSSSPLPQHVQCVATPAQVSCYEIEVVTGRQPEAGTTSRVYLELCGAAGSSGEHRLTYGDERAARAAFSAGATDSFRLHCAPLGTLLKVGWEGQRGSELQGSNARPGTALSKALYRLKLLIRVSLCHCDAPSRPYCRCACTTAMQGPTPLGSSRRCGCGSRAAPPGRCSPAAAGWRCTRTMGALGDGGGVWPGSGISDLKQGSAADVMLSCNRVSPDPPTRPPQSCAA
mgnify:CR=1 FL=1